MSYKPTENAALATISFFLPSQDPEADCSGTGEDEWLTVHMGGTNLTLHGSYDQLSDFGDAVCRAIVDARLTGGASRRQDEEDDDYGLERDHRAHDCEEAEQW
jgi:hypothetical protein